MRSTGGIDRNQKIKTYHDLNGHDEPPNKLNILKDLMGLAG
ncbi:MAG: hypothetical protein VYA34_14070 [Myxococcota bacterium]|nr:hypothetical protein [Myxococcota bacterium]